MFRSLQFHCTSLQQNPPPSFKQQSDRFLNVGKWLSFQTVKEKEGALGFHVKEKDECEKWFDPM